MKLIALILLVSSGASFADSTRTSCTAKVANRTYQVSLDEATRELKVDVDTGAKHVATANFFHSIIRNADIWAIPPAYNAPGLEFVYDIAGNKNWVCLTASECYGCR